MRGTYGDRRRPYRSSYVGRAMRCSGIDETTSRNRAKKALECAAKKSLSRMS